ncbi:hypothetical protein SYNPS1DRAFT_28849 [Syncephalis pseudoplumigaleata]|uniref:Transmembrane protein 223-domain-containing protein n=1 Tax=Syncephalis pseudoplumigaleata TaxID=1712513 RepID=A0A4P9YZ57_9FUNG|nr:hypothetical protein SYNPS1DRAFT_28849 [Syncephalis pseudoplumigaleata]|eukprot:RKP25417.1 hypothetical protein SYNPS1DRAFT_28849 [Syncephalis pseudoplumigaleata]
MSFLALTGGVGIRRLSVGIPARHVRHASSFASRRLRAGLSSTDKAASRPKPSGPRIDEQDRESLRQVLATVRAGQPVVLYEWNYHRFSTLVHAAAFFQLLLWLNGAWLAMDYLTVAKTEETAPDDAAADARADVASERELAPLWRRAAVATGLTVLGCGISASLVLYASRFVTRLQLLNRGDLLRIETGGVSWLSKPRQLPVSKAVLRERIWTGQGSGGVTRAGGSPFITLRVQGEYMGYIMDRSTGRFAHPRALDALVYRPLPPSK